MCLTPCSVAIWFSILRATSVSSCDGEAPGSDAVTVTVGRSMSGKFWIFIARKLISPTAVSMMKSSIPGIGLRIDQEETLITAWALRGGPPASRSEEHTSELQSRGHLVCRLLLEKKKTK